MSKYGNLRKEDGTHSKFFLTRTLAEHDDTMDHPFMKAIYDQSVANDTFHRYLAGQYHLFRALEEHLAIAATTPPLDAVHDASLARTTALESDLRHHCGGRWAQAEGLKADASNALRNYIEQLSKDAASPHRLLCHHFLQYNAVLSGGSYLRRMLNKKFERPEGNQEGVAFFCFAHVPVSKQAAYVQSYCKKLDKLSLSGQQRNEMLACMKLVYKLTLAMLDELAPRDAKAVAAATVWNDQVVEDGLKSLPLEKLHHFDGSSKREARILISLRGRILDVTKSSDAYGPTGNYRLFAGHDITKSLTVMSLEASDLDDLDYVPNTEDEKRALARWESRLSAMYKVVGYLKGDDRRLLDLAPSAAAPSSEPTEQASSCPFTGNAATPGEAGGSCPFGFGTGSAAAPAATAKETESIAHTGPECPWPFIMLHDPARGNEVHRAKNTAAMVGAAGIALAYGLQMAFRADN